MAIKPSISILIIGDEILKGQTQDTNSHFLCREFYACGVTVGHISVVSDDVKAIAAEVSKLSSQYTYVITSGGVGPTHDDTTYEAVAKAFGEELVLNTELQNIMSSTKEAYVPQSSKIHRTHNFSIPIVSSRNVFMFPGIPSYLRFAFKELKHVFCGKACKPYSTRNLYLSVDEFSITDILTRAAEEYRDRVKFGCYPYLENSWYKVKISLEADSEGAVVDAEAFLRNSLPQNCIVGEHPPCSEEAMAQLMDVYDGKSVDGRFVKCVKDGLSVLEECFRRYTVEKVCLSFNGGKDCTVLLHLAHLCLLRKGVQEVPRLKVLYVSSKHPFSETEQFIKLCVRRYNLELLSYEQPIREALVKLRADRPEIEAVLMGSRRTDPTCSLLQPFQETDAGWPHFVRVSPLADWSYPDIWTFLRTLQVPYCSIYDRGYTSLGCQHNTLPNDQLLARTKGGETFYLPAYLLKEPGQEREGRSHSTSSEESNAQ